MKDRAGPQLAGHGNVSVMLGDDPLHLRQPQPRPPARLLGREEGLKNVVQVLGANAGARVAHDRPAPIPRPPPPPRARAGRPHRRAAQADVQRAAVRHGIAGVERQVHDHLLHPRRVRQHEVLARRIVELDLDALRQRLPQQLRLLL